MAVAEKERKQPTVALALFVGEKLIDADENARSRRASATPPSTTSVRERRSFIRRSTPSARTPIAAGLSTIYTVDEVRDPRARLRLTTKVNGKLRQDASTSDMLFSVAQILAYISQALTLNPGDVGAISDGREAAVDGQIHPIHVARIV